MQNKDITEVNHSTELVAFSKVKQTTDQFISYGTNLCEMVLNGNIPMPAFFKNYFPDYYGYIDRALEAFNQKAPYKITCSASCGHCCENLVAISPLEAAYLLYKAPMLLSTAEINLFSNQATSRNEFYQNLAVRFPLDRESQGKNYLEAKLGCIFLTKERNCAVYPYRPTICRNLNVVSPTHLCGETKDSEEVKVWRHPSLWKIDLKFQQLLSQYYLGLDQYDIMQSLICDILKNNSEIKTDSEAYIH